MVPGAGVLPSGGCASRLVDVPPVWWMCLPSGGCVLPSGGGVSRLVVVSSRLVVVSPVWWWCLVPRQHIAAGHPGGYARQLLSAAGSLASESKLQGEIDRYDYSYYQLFRCSFWVCF